MFSKILSNGELKMKYEKVKAGAGTVLAHEQTLMES